MDFIEYHRIYQRSHAVQLRLYVVIHTIIELSLLQLIDWLVYCLFLMLWAHSTNTCAPSLELDAYLVSAFVRYPITKLHHPLCTRTTHCFADLGPKSWSHKTSLALKHPRGLSCAKTTSYHITGCQACGMVQIWSSDQAPSSTLHQDYTSLHRSRPQKLISQNFSSVEASKRPQLC